MALAKLYWVGKLYDWLITWWSWELSDGRSLLCLLFYVNCKAKQLFVSQLSTLIQNSVAPSWPAERMLTLSVSWSSHIFYKNREQRRKWNREATAREEVQNGHYALPPFLINYGLSQT